jgi:hypothetical protein
MLLRGIISILINALVLIVIAGYIDTFHLESVSAADSNFTYPAGDISYAWPILIRH